MATTTSYGDVDETAIGRDRDVVRAMRIDESGPAPIGGHAVQDASRPDALRVGRSRDSLANAGAALDLRGPHGLDSLASAGDRMAVHAPSGLPGDPLLRLLGTMRMGAVLVSREGRVVYLNDAGREALHAQVGLALRGDHVVAAAPDTRRKLVAALNGACRAPFVDGAVLLSSTDGRGITKPLRVLSMERVAGVPHHRDEGLALLCIGSARQRSPEAPMLAQLFGLTAAESALMAAVAGGERLHECATRRGVSLATVRAQLRNVFVKTGAGRRPT